jgi:hypothetical protein
MLKGVEGEQWKRRTYERGGWKTRSTRMRAMVVGAERERGIYEMDQSESNSSRSSKCFPTFAWMFIRQREVVPIILYFFITYSTNCNIVRICAIVYISVKLRASLHYKICCEALHSPYNLFHFPPWYFEHPPSLRPASSVSVSTERGNGKH